MFPGVSRAGRKAGGAARREALEETGLSLGALTLVGAYSGPDFHWIVPNGDEVYNVTVAYMARDFSGTPVADGEGGTEVVFMSLSPLPELLGPSARPVLTDLTARDTLNAVL